MFEDPGESSADPDMLICDPATPIAGGHASIVDAGNEDKIVVLLTTLIA